jgi:hypothetical protein
VHPGAGLLVARGHLAREQRRQAPRLGELLPEHDLAAQSRAERGAEAGEDREQRAAALGVATHLGEVVVARALDVGLELVFVGPDRVFHEQRELVHGRRLTRHRGEVDALERRPRQRHEQLRGHVVAQRIERAHVVAQLAGVDPLGGAPHAAASPSQ